MRYALVFFRHKDLIAIASYGTYTICNKHNIPKTTRTHPFFTRATWLAIILFSHESLLSTIARAHTHTFGHIYYISLLLRPPFRSVYISPAYTAVSRFCPHRPRPRRFIVTERKRLGLRRRRWRRPVAHARTHAHTHKENGTIYIYLWYIVYIVSLLLSLDYNTHT